MTHARILHAWEGVVKGELLAIERTAREAAAFAGSCESGKEKWPRVTPRCLLARARHLRQKCAPMIEDSTRLFVRDRASGPPVRVLAGRTLDAEFRGSPLVRQWPRNFRWLMEKPPGRREDSDADKL